MNTQTKFTGITDLAEIKIDDTYAVFTKENGLKPYLDVAYEAVQKMILDTESDATKAKGRTNRKSIARKIGSLKARLDEIGKDVVSEMKNLPKKVDAERKRMRDLLEAWQSEVLEPVEQWEANERRIEQEAEDARIAEVLRIKVEELNRQIENDHELALLLDEKFNREAADREAKALAEKLAHEQRIAAEAAERARQEQAAAIERERQLAIERENRRAAEAEAQIKAAQENAARIERQAKEAQESAKQKAMRDAADAERRQAEAVAQERRKAAEAEAEKERERARREANMDHRRKINNQVLNMLIDAGATVELAKRIIETIVKSGSPIITINY